MNRRCALRPRREFNFSFNRSITKFGILDSVYSGMNFFPPLFIPLHRARKPFLSLHTPDPHIKGRFRSTDTELNT
jgi:hypothetical protein